MSDDSYYNNVSLLLHFDGADNSTTFTDDSPSPKTITVYGNAHIETDKSKFGLASGAFDGAGDYLTVPRAALTFVGDFTIECWVYVTTASTYVPILDGRTTPGYSDFELGLYPNKLDIVMGGSRLTATATMTTGAWHHIAVSRASGVVRLFTDGVVNTGTWSYSTNITPVATNVRIGGNIDGYYLNGYLDDLRVTPGVARYTTSFTPPTQAFSDSRIPTTSLPLAAFAMAFPVQPVTVLFNLYAIATALPPVEPPSVIMNFDAYPAILEAVLLPSATEFRHAPLIPWIMPMTSPVYPPVTTATLTTALPGGSVHGFWSPQDMLFGWTYDSGNDTISIPLTSLFELTAAQAHPITGDWRAVMLALINSMWDAYVELDNPPKAVVMDYNPGYMMPNGPFSGAVKADYVATTYLTFPEKYIAGEP